MTPEIPMRNADDYRRAIESLPRILKYASEGSVYYSGLYARTSWAIALGTWDPRVWAS